MKNINFFSNSKYIVLPTKINPKVFLAIDNHIVKKNSFKLYNPFSLKGKILKKLAFNFSVFNIKKKEKSDFIKYLEKKFNKSFISSIYFSTDKNKAIIQLISNEKIYGYVKVTLTKLGEEKLQNEYSAINILKNINPIKLIDSGYFKNNYFFITEDMGNIASIEKINITKILDKFKQNKFYDFDKHPRINYLYEQLKKIDSNLINILNGIKIKRKLQLVYEHGDVAPWNILENELLFDFEYFFENGLECLDEIKYFYQIETLLKKSKNNVLIDNILSKISCKEKDEFFKLFLLKEIIVKYKEQQNISLELDLLKRVKKYENINISICL